MYLKERLLISLNPQKFFLARSNAKNNSFFIWVVMFRGTQREYSSKPLKHSIVKLILEFKQ